MKNNLIKYKTAEGYTLMTEYSGLKNELKNKFLLDFGFEVEDVFLMENSVYCKIDTKLSEHEKVVDFIDYLSKFLGDYPTDRINYSRANPSSPLIFRIDEMDKILCELFDIDLDTPGYYSSEVKINGEYLGEKELKYSDIVTIYYIADFDEL